MAVDGVRRAPRQPTGEVPADSLRRMQDRLARRRLFGLDFVDVRITVDQRAGRVAIESEARVEARTGIEMEALVAATTAALTIYDMCKAIDRGMVIEDVCLVAKSGGRSGDWKCKR